jgi:hypothetical protein
VTRFDTSLVLGSVAGAVMGWLMVGALRAYSVGWAAACCRAVTLRQASCVLHVIDGLDRRAGVTGCAWICFAGSVLNWSLLLGWRVACLCVYGRFQTSMTAVTK